MKKNFVVVIGMLTLGSHLALAQSPAPNMSFFVTSSNAKGGNLGGLTGADAMCQSLARAAGAVLVLATALKPLVLKVAGSSLHADST